MLIRQSEAYARWFSQLRDARAQGRILARIRRLSLGHLGDAKSVGQGVHELRIDYGPGYRVYFTRQGRDVVLLLAGGDKGTQRRDIARAANMVRQLRKTDVHDGDNHG